MQDVAPNCFIHTLYEDSRGFIWAGTYGKGIYMYNPASKEIKHYHRNVGMPYIGSDYITSIYEDRRKHLWFATEGSGLYKLIKPDTFVHYSTENGFPSTVICGICEDSKGVLWISSTGGLLKFNPETETIFLFDKNDGLTNNHFSYNSTFIDATGRMYFGTLEGMITFNPSDIKENNATPPVFITEFHLLNGTDTMTDFCKSIFKTKSVKLSYNNSSFNVGFVAPTYSNPLRIKYRYILENYDKEWIYLTNYQSASYANVPPGKYILKVSASSDSRNWIMKHNCKL
jgi:sugar lactone lactonase YvrE